MRGYLSWLQEPRKVGVAEFDVPRPAPSDLVVEVIRANVCGSDVSIWKGNHARLKQPPLGHEFVGVVTALGSEVSTDRAGNPLAVGDRVVSTYFPVCHHCAACARTQYGSCERAYAYRGAPVDVAPYFHGAFASHYYIHHDQYFFKVPDRVSDAAAAGANCGIATVLEGCNRLSPVEGGIAAVIGLGGLGVSASAILALRGWRVIGVDLLPQRRETAKSFGAAEAVAESKDARSLLGRRGADVVIDVSGDPAAFAEAVLTVAPGGTILEIGNVDQGPNLVTSLAPADLVRRSISVHGVIRYPPDRLLATLDFLAAEGNDIPFDEQCDQTFPLSAVDKALLAAEQRTCTRVALTPADA
ncbi:zinc-binding dehydrogenase [Kribbella sp. NPDC056345]|uniref:zinc-binding dehydrogenase n=1 Tax=Kribbella sp. NPDC056345 TaxID=3345789 RepID=UPI0035D7CD7B